MGPRPGPPTAQIPGKTTGTGAQIHGKPAIFTTAIQRPEGSSLFAAFGGAIFLRMGWGTPEVKEGGFWECQI